MVKKISIREAIIAMSNESPLEKKLSHSEHVHPLFLKPTPFLRPPFPHHFRIVDEVWKDWINTA